MTEITADPEPVADDSDHPLAVEMAEIFTADSPFMEDLTSFVTDVFVGQDVGVRPGPDGLSQHTTLADFTEADSEDPDFVSFVFCSYHDGVAYSLSTGEEEPPSIGITDGAGQAVRTSGQWRLHRLQELGHHGEPAGTPNPCPDLASTAQGERT